MADKTGIEWTDATWNPLAGCTIVSKGCTNCYAMSQAARLLDKPGSHYEGTTKRVNGKAVWTGKVTLAPDHILRQPLKWTRPRRVFVNSMSDLFHESVPDEWIDKVFAVMALSPQHTFQVLTKRPERMRDYCNGNWHSRIVDHLRVLGQIPEGKGVFLRTKNLSLPNLWLGVSVEDQASADARIPHLLQTPAATRFLSCEPLLGPVDLSHFIPGELWYMAKCESCLHFESTEYFNGGGDDGPICPKCYSDRVASEYPGIGWVIVGGESGPGANPMHPDWVRKIRDQTQAVKKHYPGDAAQFFFKQWGEWSPVDSVASETAESLELQNKYLYMLPDGTSRGAGGTDFIRTGKKNAGRLLDGRTWNEYPGFTGEEL